jgi:cleavage and polyadenylation specificity factor subunit 1
MGALLQQLVKNAWEPLSSKKLIPAQQKYSAHDRELLTIYEAVKHFRHFIFAGHKPTLCSRSGTDAHRGSSAISIS